MPGTTSEMHRDVAKTKAIIYEVHRDVVGIQQILKTREDNVQHWTVSDLPISWHCKIKSHRCPNSEQLSGSRFVCP